MFWSSTVQPKILDSSSKGLQVFVLEPQSRALLDISKNEWIVSLHLSKSMDFATKWWRLNIRLKFNWFRVQGHRKYLGCGAQSTLVTPVDCSDEFYDSFPRVQLERLLSWCRAGLGSDWCWPIPGALFLRKWWESRNWWSWLFKQHWETSFFRQCGIIAKL